MPVPPSILVAISSEAVRPAVVSETGPGVVYSKLYFSGKIANNFSITYYYVTYINLKPTETSLAGIPNNSSAYCCDVEHLNTHVCVSLAQSSPACLVSVNACRFFIIPPPPPRVFFLIRHQN